MAHLPPVLCYLIRAGIMPHTESEGGRMRASLGSVNRMGTGTKGAQLRCGIVRSLADNRERDFVTPQYAIVYLPDGRGRYFDDHGVAYDVPPGSFFQRFPSRRHSVRMVTDGLRCWVAVPCQVFELLALMGLASHARPVVHVGSDRKLVDEFASIRDELAARYERELVATLMRMQRFLVKLHTRGRKNLADERDATPVARAMQILNENVERRLRLPDVAREVGMSYSAFRKRFLEQVGTPPGDYRIRRRMERAMELLTGEDLLVKEVAARLGYPDEYAFSAQFRKMTGSSPRAFRMQNA